MTRKLSSVICNQDALILPETTTMRVACRHMRERNAGSVLVTDDSGALVGIFTGRDVVRAVAGGKSPEKTPLSKVMTRNPVTIHPGKTALDALRLMWDGGFRHVPVLDNGRILACVSRGDFRSEEVGEHEDERELWEHMR